MIANEHIKIQNLYYIFLYAWEKFYEGRSLKLDVEDGPDLPNLLTSILIKSIKRIVKKGLHKDYKSIIINETFIRGKIDFKQSISNNFMATNKLSCRVSDLSVDSLLNKVLKKTLINLKQNRKVKENLRKEICFLLKFFGDVEEVDNIGLYLSKSKLSQNNNYYRLPIELCRMLNELRIPTHEKGTYIFSDILDDEIRMGDIFERFVGSFFKHEQIEFQVKTSQQLSWQFHSLGGDMSLIPKQMMDITLSNKKKIVIIDTKFYKKPLVNKYLGQDKFIPDHLRQIVTYISNTEHELEGNKEIEGILLYADVEGLKRLNEKYMWRDHTISIKSINLNQDWQKVHRELLSIVN